MITDTEIKTKGIQILAQGLGDVEAERVLLARGVHLPDEASATSAAAQAAASGRGLDPICPPSSGERARSPCASRPRGRSARIACTRGSGWL